MIPFLCHRRRDADLQVGDAASRSVEEDISLREFLVSVEHEEPRNASVRILAGDKFDSDNAHLCAWATKQNLTCSSLLPREQVKEQSMASRSEVIDTLTGNDDVSAHYVPEPFDGEIMLCTISRKTDQIACQELSVPNPKWCHRHPKFSPWGRGNAEKWFGPLCLNYTTTAGKATATRAAVSIFAKSNATVIKQAINATTILHREALLVTVFPSLEATSVR